MAKYIPEETEEKLDQAVTLIKMLVNNPTEEIKTKARLFAEDYDNPQIGYHYSELTGKEEDLKF